MHPDATGAWTVTLPTTPDGGPYTLTATSGKQVSTPVTATMDGTTITGPALAPRGGHIAALGPVRAGTPGRGLRDRDPTPSRGCSRPSPPPPAPGRSRHPSGRPPGGTRSPTPTARAEGHTTLHGVTVAGPKKAGLRQAGRPHAASPRPRAKVVVFTHSYHGKSSIGHVVQADARGAYRLKTSFAVSSIWWATSAGSRSPTHTTLLPSAQTRPRRHPDTVECHRELSGRN